MWIWKIEIAGCVSWEVDGVVGNRAVLTRVVEGGSRWVSRRQFSSIREKCAPSRESSFGVSRVFPTASPQPSRLFHQRKILVTGTRVLLRSGCLPYHPFLTIELFPAEMRQWFDFSTSSHFGVPRDTRLRWGSTRRVPFAVGSLELCRRADRLMDLR